MIDSAVILFIVILNAVIGVIQQKKAEKSLNALKELSAPVAKVIRDGKEISVPAKELVPGDLVLMEAGDVVPADVRLVMTANFKVQEAALTGESLPVDKDATAILEEKAPVGDRINMALSLSLIHILRVQVMERGKSVSALAIRLLKSAFLKRDMQI